MKPIKPKKCRICKELFTPFRPLQVCCTAGCAIELAQKARTRKEAIEHTQAKERIKTRGDHAKEAQAAFNAYIRARDADLPCVSCGRHSGQRHASHFYATSIRPNLRFDESNVHASCAQCNKWMHGNLIPYRVELLNRIGKEELGRLDADIEPKHYSIEELKNIKDLYKKKIKVL